MKSKPLVVYFVILSALCAADILGARMLGKTGAYLAQLYMLTPAIAALITRLFFYEPRFKDANLRFGRLRDYLTFWLASLGIMTLAFILYTLLGAVTWDFTGGVFLERLAEQSAAVGQDITTGLPPGFTPQMMLLVFFVGGLTVFNILPGIITGFGEEFGHRGFMFPALYRIRPWIGLVIGGLIWYAWHLPLALLIPQPVEHPVWQTVLNLASLAIGSVFTFIYLAYVYIKSRSIFVVSIAHIAMNNASASFSYFAVVQNPVLANFGLTVAMMIVVAILYFRRELDIFPEYFATEGMS
jgi:membrane protease YdiL (CAAX protease family)